ncbi:MAG: response regulator transcription factor, partial [Phycisphaerales bacterium JB059]
PGWLTNREQVVLEELILGRSVREIAETMHRSPHTVHDHVKSLHRKLGASSRGALIAHALGCRNGDQTPRVMATPCRTGGRARSSAPGSRTNHLEPKPAARSAMAQGG